MIVAADTGGTYVDLVDETGRATKVAALATAGGRPLRGALAPYGRPQVLAHGTTVATNALLERRGGRTALVTTEGFRDVLEIGRQDRPSLYDPFADRPDPLVPRDLRFEVRGRLGPQGEEVAPLVLEDLAPVPLDVDEVAVCLLHSDVNDAHERAVAAHLRERGVTVSASVDVSPEFREFERTSTTVTNAYLRPVCRSSLAALTGLADEVVVMTSAGALLTIGEAGELPVALLLSGPAGGARATAALTRALGHRGSVSLDMGGTSTDVCLVLDGEAERTPSLVIDGFPVRYPALRIHTVGSGGGSLAWLDAGRALRVGPRSAGADPGPVCFGRGGDTPTVTDADLATGRIPADAPLPGLPTLDVDGARESFRSHDIDPEGVIKVVDADIARAVRRVSVERGVDPRELPLVAFGGAGPLHACAVAESLGMRTVVVPPRAGVFSAVGLLTSRREREVVRSWPSPDDHEGLDAALDRLENEARSLAGPGAAVATATDCRYRGQSHELTVPRPDDFHAEHDRTNGFRRDDAPVQVVALRARATLPERVAPEDLPPPDRVRSARGPQVIAEDDCTVFLRDGWTLFLDDTGAWILERS